jgi:hypothetical protein
MLNFYAEKGLATRNCRQNSQAGNLLTHGKVPCQRLGRRRPGRGSLMLRSVKKVPLQSTYRSNQDEPVLTADSAEDVRPRPEAKPDEYRRQCNGDGRDCHGRAPVVLARIRHRRWGRRARPEHRIIAGHDEGWNATLDGRRLTRPGCGVLTADACGVEEEVETFVQVWCQETRQASFAHQGEPDHFTGKVASGYAHNKD